MAQRKGREPVSVGFRKGDVVGVESQDESAVPSQG